LSTLSCFGPSFTLGNLYCYSYHWIIKICAVDISKNECSCEFYQEELIPCRHAIKFFTSIRRDPKDYCSDIQTVEYLREMYAEGADPLCVTVINDLCIDPLITPTVETLRGRRRKNRIKSQSIVCVKSAENQVCNLPIM